MTNDPLNKIVSSIHSAGQALRKLKLGFKLQITLAGLVLLLLGFNLFLVYVHPDEFGIKVNRVGLNRGVQKEVYGAGLTFVLPFGLQQMYRLPKNIQVLELTNFPETAAASARKAARAITAMTAATVRPIPIRSHSSNRYRASSA